MRSIAPALALALLTVGGCAPEAPTAPHTVRLAVAASAHHGGRPLVTEMTQEVTTQPVWFGDADGSGVALITVNYGQREICWELSVADVLLPATAAHIHEAAPGVRGGIVVGLSAPDASGTARGCVGEREPALLKRLLQNPELFYVNVHTTDFPAGAVRGQLGD